MITIVFIRLWYIWRFTWIPTLILWKNNPCSKFIYKPYIFTKSNFILSPFYLSQNLSTPIIFLWIFQNIDFSRWFFFALRLFHQTLICSPLFVRKCKMSKHHTHTILFLYRGENTLAIFKAILHLLNRPTISGEIWKCYSWFVFKNWTFF